MFKCLFFNIIILFCVFAHAQTPNTEISDWIDTETGHRIIKVSNEPYSGLSYFTVNSVSSDKKFMAYTSPQGIHLIDLKSFSTHLIVPCSGTEFRFIEMGRKSSRLYYSVKRDGAEKVSLESIDIFSKKITTHYQLPARYYVTSINADESLAAGLYESEPLVKVTYNGKADRLYRRVLEKIPMAIFTVDLSKGVLTDIYKSTEWLSHVQFSPADSNLIMYSLEGPWHFVDRIWTIRSDGTQKRLIHRRTMQMEIAGHEFWGQDGKNIYYDWQYPKGKTFYLASFDVTSGERNAISLTRDQWSIHFNSTSDDNLFVGDGGDSEQVARAPDSTYIFLYRVNPTSAGEAVDPLLWRTSDATTERLADLRGHDYKLEPYARVTPDNNWVVFHSNMFGTPAVFAVEIKRSESNKAQERSTYELSKARKSRYKSILMKN